MRNAGIQAAYTQAFKGGMAARTFEGRFRLISVIHDQPRE